jgi:PAS domain S-box-containing protein
MVTQPELAERILDQVADAVIYADHSGTIVRWNRASSALFGYSAEEAIGKSIDLIIPEHLRAAHWAGFDAAMAKGVMKLQGCGCQRPWRQRNPRLGCDGAGCNRAR